ncbi:MAG TPA: ABC transporter substrate-binding protein [Burkholderiales bacterium]|nr:ABC transporter substrate-binding protein [Burkholderiales bacterium]
MTARRAFLMAGGAGLSLLAAPVVSVAQQKGKIWRIGFFYLGSRELALDRYGIFLEGMRELGYTEGRNFVVEMRPADAQYERLPGIAAELVQLKVDVIVANGTFIYRTLQKATSTIPIVITTSPDPVKEGFAKSLARPGGNITGLSTGNAEIAPKYVELMHLAMPKLSRLAVLMNTTNVGHPGQLAIVRSAARKAGMTLIEVDAHNSDEIDRGFRKFVDNRAEGVIAFGDTFFSQQMRQIVELAIRHRLPSLFTTPEYAAAGGFLSYGPDTRELFRRAAFYVDKIFKGAKPGDLPIELPTKFELIVNRKTGNRLGLVIPQELILRADRVIE